METGQSGPTKFFLATVASVTAADGVSIIPDGQTEPVPKKYKILLTCAVPAAGERVVVMKHSGTCVILGAIGTPNQVDQKVNRSGDTMTGALTMNGADINLRSTTNTIGTVPATSTSDKRIYFRDKLNAVYGKLQTIFLNDGRTGIQIGAQRAINGSTVENNLALYVDASGNRTVTLTSPQVWRSALGLGTSGAFPLTIAQGGSGSTKVVSETTIANIITAAPGFSITVARYHVWGKVAMFIIDFTATAAVTANQWTAVGTLASGKRPVDTQVVRESNDRLVAMYNTGMIQMWGTVSAGTVSEICATYLLA